VRGRVQGIIPRARRLLTEQTDAERALWERLRSRALLEAKFRRQHPVGRFIADFCSPQHHLIIELDGGQHAERSEEDAQRTAQLGALGDRVVRFWNNDVLDDIDSVLEQIVLELDAPHPNSLPRGARG
jgi:very-short-patch-repair endonuclease